jgi:hypothetical protein
MYLLIVFVLNSDLPDFLILILNLCILWINLDLHIFIKSNGVYSSLFWINVGLCRPSGERGDFFQHSSIKIIDR